MRLVIGKGTILVDAKNQYISVIIPTHNRLFCLKGCLKSLLAQNFNTFEIIIINDGSTDGTKEYLDSLKNKKIKVYHQKNQGVSQARNQGIKLAKSDLIAFIDDDCVAERNWLKKLSEVFKKDNPDFVIGKTIYVAEGYKGYFPERLIHNDSAKWPGAGNIVYKKSVFAKVGGFDSYFEIYNNEDTEMAIRAFFKGFKHKSAPRAIVYHQKSIWTPHTLIDSAKNAAVWPIIKKKYPKDYLEFKPKIIFGTIIMPSDYIYLLFAVIIIPILLIRYLIHGKYDLKIFFTKWPLLLILRRYYIYREALKNKIFMI